MCERSSEWRGVCNVKRISIYVLKPGDYGIDIIVEYEKKYAVQCKHHSNPVGPAPLRELRGVVEVEFDKRIFVSLNGYTKQAKSENYSAYRKLILKILL